MINFMRLLATLFITFGVYLETGPFTAGAVVLIALALEYHNGMFKVLLPPAKDCDEEDSAE